MSAPCTAVFAFVITRFSYLICALTISVFTRVVGEITTFAFSYRPVVLR